MRVTRTPDQADEFVGSIEGETLHGMTYLGIVQSWGHRPDKTHYDVALGWNSFQLGGATWIHHRTGLNGEAPGKRRTPKNWFLS